MDAPREMDSAGTASTAPTNTAAQKLREIGHRVPTLQALGDALSVVGTHAHEQEQHEIGFLIGFLVDRYRVELSVVQTLSSEIGGAP